MIPILYDSDETEFVSNGLGRLRDAVSVIVSEERNGLYEVQFEYPVDGVNFDRIQCGRIIGVTHDETNDIQPFDIYSYEKPIAGIVTFHARHISYRLNKMTLTGGAGATGIQNAFALLANSTPLNPFTFETDIKNTTSYMSATAGAPITVRQVLGGVKGSILDAFGGEYEWDKWTVKLWKGRGETQALTIRYGVNLIDYNEDIDFANTYTAMLPYWAGNSNGRDVIVRGDVVDSGLDRFDGHDTCVPMDFSEKFENKPTKASLNSLASTYMRSNNTSLPSQSIKVDFVRLADTEEYKQYASLQSCKLCDTVTVEFPKYGMSGQFKIVRTEYDVLRERYQTLELGTLSTTLAEALGISQESNNPNGADAPIDTLSVGSLFLDGHTSAVGAYGAGANAQNIASGTSFTDTGVEFTLPAGRFIVEAYAGFAGNTTGFRGIRINASDDSSSTDVSTMSSQIQPTLSAAGWTDRLHTSAMVISDNGSVTVKVQVLQNSGSSLSVTAQARWIRIR